MEVDMKTILGLIGAPGAGKDFLADFLVEKGFKKFAFADRIKEEYYKIIGITEEAFKSCRETEEEKIIRAGLWKYSDEMKAKYGSLYFIKPEDNTLNNVNRPLEKSTFDFTKIVFLLKKQAESTFSIFPSKMFFSLYVVWDSSPRRDRKCWPRAR